MVAVGLLLGAYAPGVGFPRLVLVDADVLRSGYGLCQFTGLLTAQRLAPVGSLATVVGGRG